MNLDREALADILTNEEPDSYAHGGRTFRDWMLEYADNVLRAVYYFEERVDSRTVEAARRLRSR